MSETKNIIFCVIATAIITGFTFSAALSVLIGMMANNALNTALAQAQNLQLDCTEEYNQNAAVVKFGKTEYYCILREKQAAQGSLQFPPDNE